MAGRHGEHLQSMRVEYGSVEKDGSPDLDADWLDDGWLALLRRWIDDAERLGVAEPNAMVLATVAAGRPASRSVLCKSVDETGITFFTHYDSAKGAELGGDAVRLGDVSLVPAGAAGPYPRPGEQGLPAGHRGLLVQAAAGFTAGRVGIAPVAADRVARGAA